MGRTNGSLSSNNNYKKNTLGIIVCLFYIKNPTISLTKPPSHANEKNATILYIEDKKIYVGYEFF